MDATGPLNLAEVITMPKPEGDRHCTKFQYKYTKEWIEHHLGSDPNRQGQRDRVALLKIDGARVTRLTCVDRIIFWFNAGKHDA